MLAATVVWSSGTVDAAAPSPAEQAAAEIQEARDRADAAAQALFDTESEIDRLSIDVGEAQERLDEVEALAATMRSGLEEAALRRFIGAGGNELPLLEAISDANDALAADVLSAVATESVYLDIDEYDAVALDVADARADLERQQAAAADAAQRYADLIEQTEQEIIRLGEIEEQRLADEAVQRALAEQQRQRVEQERRESEAVAAAAAAEAERAAAQAAAASSGGASPTPAQVAAPKDSSTPTTTSAPQGAGSDLACPVNGTRAFADTWGAPRSGGRTHVGVDIIAPSGTPLVAMEAGRIEFRSNRLGGKTLRLYGDSGTRYYYAHLSAYEGSNRPVAKGDVVGYVGRTGNTTTNHLHLQIHPGGGQPVNPYPYARAACG